MPSALLRFAQSVTQFNQAVFRAVAWLLLPMVLIYFAVVVLRYAFNWGAVAMQESVTYLNAIVFMLAAAAGISLDSHVRVDVLYTRWDARHKALVNALGSLVFLLPFSLFLLAVSWSYVTEAWRLGERSMDAGGLPFVYLLKTLILIAAAQLVLQALATAAQNLDLWRRGAQPKSSGP